jgi:hypothetical protein
MQRCMLGFFCGYTVLNWVESLNYRMLGTDK